VSAGIVAGLALAWWGPGLFFGKNPVPWGDGPLNVWNLLLAVFLIVVLAGAIYGEISGWRSSWRRYSEELAGLASREAIRRQLVHGTLSLLIALIGLVVVILGRRRGPFAVWHLASAAVLICGPGGVMLFHRGLRAYWKQQRNRELSGHDRRLRKDGTL